MKSFQRLELLALLLGLTLVPAAPLLAAELPTVAVVDFISTNGPVDGVMLGAADLLEAELSRYDVRVISRRELNMLRGERGLARSGFTRIEDFQGGALPWADFLLRGEYQYGEGESGVRFRLVDAATGTERGSWQLLVERPADLVKSLDPILPKIAAVVCGRTEAPPRPRNQPGFTTIPEAASTFYHGVDHLVAGRPEYAAEYFRIAAASDAGFSLAVLGQAKAYELLGFLNVANAVRATIPAGQLPQAQAAGTSSVLTVRFVNRTDRFTAGQMQRIREVLQETHGFALFEPDWIPALTRETDLKLSEDFPLVHGLDHRLWLRADHFVVFSAEKKGLSASVIDLLHGQLLGTVTGGSTNLDGLCAEAVAIIRRPGIAAADMPLAQPSNTNGPAAKLSFTYSVAEVAFALRHLGERPKDLACWAHVLGVMQPERLPPGVFSAFLDAHEAAIPPDAPDAADWLASVLWARYFLEAQAAADLPDVEKSFAPLLQRYPDSLQAEVIRFHIARLLHVLGEPERARTLAVEVASKTAPRVQKMDSFIPLRGQYLDCIPQIEYSAFPHVISPQSPRMGMLARDMYGLAAYLSTLGGDLTNAMAYQVKAEALDREIRLIPARGVHLGGPVSFYPVQVGVWQTGHIGFTWKPADPADDRRVQVGWNFMPYAMSSNKPTIAAMKPMDFLLAHNRKCLDACGVTTNANPPGSYLFAPGASNDDRPPRVIWQDWLDSISSDGTPYPGENAYLRALNVFAYTCSQTGRAQGAVAAADFAVQAVAEYREAGKRMVAAVGEIRAGKLAIRMYGGAAYYCMEAGELAKAWALTQQALAWRGRDDLKYSLRYQAARAAWQAGRDDTAALVLRTMAEDPRAKDLPLILPFIETPLRSVYLESVDLLEKVRAGSDPNIHPADIDLTPVKPYYIGGIRPGTTKQEKPKRSMRDPTRDEEWAQIMGLWFKSMEGKPMLYEQDMMPESYEAWPEPEEVPDWVRVPSPPRFGEPYVYEIDDEVSMEFVWIESMRMWVAKYELTEIEWFHVTTQNRTAGRLPILLKSFSDSQPFFGELNRRAQKGLPEGYCYRSPTVAEWERLARCGTDRVYPWGNAMPPTSGNYRDQSYAKAARAKGDDVADVIAGYDDGHEQVATVEDSGVNEWGLYGMGGNLWDWATKPHGGACGKGGTWQSSGDELRVDAGYWVDEWGDGGTLRVVLAPEIKPATPLP